MTFPCHYTHQFIPLWIRMDSLHLQSSPPIQTEGQMCLYHCKWVTMINLWGLPFPQIKHYLNLFFFFSNLTLGVGTHGSYPLVPLPHPRVHRWVFRGLGQKEWKLCSDLLWKSYISPRIDQVFCLPSPVQNKGEKKVLKELTGPDWQNGPASQVSNVNIKHLHLVVLGFRAGCPQICPSDILIILNYLYLRNSQGKKDT